MRIKAADHRPQARDALKRAMVRARTEGPVPEPVCSPCCPNYEARVGCHRRCEHAPVRLSSDPEAYPIEPRVAPLVFELKRLGVFDPCWSCEGHDHDHTPGALWKVPRVWFYADSVQHVRALSEALADLAIERRLSTPWRVVVTHSDDGNPATAFSLEPDAQPGAVLSRLQADLDVLAETVAERFRAACARLEALSSQG
jgi:hypothetical protein